MSISPLAGAGSDRTINHASPFFAPRTFPVLKKPIQTAEEFGKGKIRTP